MSTSAPILPYEPTLAYARSHSLVDSTLVTLLSEVKRDCDAATARNAFLKFQGVADKGSAFAMCFCSRFCRDGWGTIQSNYEALQWAKKAAETGFPPGHYEFGRCHEDGIGVPCDLAEAARLYIVSIKGGFGFAALQLSLLYHFGKLSAEGREMDVEWARKAYELNEPLAAGELGRWYELGEGVHKNVEEAVAWYVRASELGDFLASGRLSLAYALGDLGIQPNAEMARRYEQICSAQTPAN